MSLYAAIAYLRPGADFLTGIVLRKEAAGEPYIVQWNDPRPQPTQAEIDAAMPAAFAAAARAAIPPVSARQMLIALDEADLLDSIEAYVAQQPRVVQITWQRSQEFQRDNPILAVGAQALGMTDEQVDGLFALAATK